MKSSMSKTIHIGMIISHLPTGRQVRDSPDEKSGQALWPYKNKL